MTTRKMDIMTLNLPLSVTAELLRSVSSIAGDLYPDTGESGDAYDSELGISLS